MLLIIKLCNMKIMWTAEIEILNEDMIMAVVITI